MKFYSVKEAANLWGISIQMVRRYCKEGKIPSADMVNGAWLIPEGTEKPGAQPIKKAAEVSPLLKKFFISRNGTTTLESMSISN